METTDEVWRFMLEHQEGKGRPPTMAEIQEAVPGLNYRSSVKYALDTLVEEGRVVEEGDPGKALRHRAIPAEGTDMVMPPPLLPDTHIVPVLDVEDMGR